MRLIKTHDSSKPASALLLTVMLSIRRLAERILDRTALKQSSYHAGSALLLTVMIIAILTTTTLASIAVRFDQLAATDKVANAAVAKSAADSALVRVKEKLTNGEAITPKSFDLETNSEADLSTTTPFRPNPKKIVSTYQKVQTSLPRCLAVGVLIPWSNDGQYLGDDNNSSNPALMFNYANIVNDTPLGVIPGNNGLSPNEKGITLSGLTNMGHFYNPFAPRGSRQSDVRYWTVKVGGPNDQFLTGKATDGASSLFKGMDFFYMPYLPRWQDSGLFNATSGTGTDRIDAASLQAKFENTIKDNSFKVWIDASVDDTQLAKYGFGDLFVSSDTYRLKWLQPSLWNDAPEADLMAPYKSDDVGLATLSWTKKSQPLMTLGANDGGWNTAITKGAQAFSFIKLTSGQGATSFSKGASITGLLYGSLEGLRLNQPLTLALLDKNLLPITLESRGSDQGRLYNVVLTKIGPTTVSNGVESINVTFTLSNDPTSGDYDTPKLLGNVRYPTWSDLSNITIIATPKASTSRSNQGVTINADADGVDATVTTNSNCAPLAGVLTSCPAVGDLVSLTKTGSVPVWGKVTRANFSADGATLSSIVVDKLHKSPPPTREMAYTYFTSGGNPRIAYYGGAIAMNDYDGGYASESNQLWIYDPENADQNAAWTYVSPATPTNPGPRAGASMVYDSVNNRLVMIGGYYHEAVAMNPAGYDCELNQLTCLYTNRPGMRVAKRVTNDVYALSLATNTWEKLDYSAGWGKIAAGTNYTVRVTSTLADRSGLERWNLTAKNPTNINQTLKVDDTASTVTVYPSAAGIAKGDQVYLYGNKVSDGHSFYAWARINFVDYATDSVNLTVYGYKRGAETSIDMKSLAIQVMSRTNVTNTCAGGFDGTYYYCTFTSSDSTGYAVGDSVVLESYTPATNAQLLNTLSGYISYIDRNTGQAYFVADEKAPATAAVIKDYSDKNTGKVIADSAVAFPSARYGATFAGRPTDATRASYWQGAAKNVNYNQRFADLWNVQFVAGGGAASAVWSFQTTTNDTTALATGGANYRFQVIKPNYTYQLSTTPSIANNPPITPPSPSAWDNGQHWSLEIASADISKVVVGAWATLERRQSDGTRQTFHGIVDNTYPTGACGNYADTKLCLRHNPAYPNDSGISADSAVTKVTMNPSFATDIQVGGAVSWNQGGGYIAMQGALSNYGAVPGQGATVMIWREPAGANPFPDDAHTFTVNSRSYNSGSGTFNFYYDKIVASPPPASFTSSQITSTAGTDRILTIGDHQLNYYDIVGAPEWIKDTSTGSWKIRLSRKFTTGAIMYRPAARRAGAISSLYDSVAQTSQTLLIGGTYGLYGTLWRQLDSGNIITSRAIWEPRFVSANAVNDVPNLFGGSLVTYKQGANVRAVYFGGKQKTDFSSADYGTTVGPYMLGRTDTGTLNDNSFFIGNSGGTDAVGFAYTIENNKATSSVAWPTNIDNSLSFRGSGLSGGQSVCAYVGQVGCSSKELLSQLGNLGRLDSTATNATYGGWTSGKAPIISQLGDAFKKQDVSGNKPSLIFSTSTASGINLNARHQQDGYQPYMTDTGLTYGRLASDFGSDKTSAYAAYASINDAGKSGGILITTVGVGLAVTNNRGGNNGTTDGWYSYCASSDVDISDYTCKPSATRYLSWLPDAEDLLFTLNASQALAAIDTYKVVGYYGGVKHGYLVTSRSGSQPTVVEIVP